jgi:hypothetical protein
VLITTRFARLIVSHGWGSAAMDPSQPDAFNNTAGSKEQCEARKALFRKFLDDFVVVEESDPHSQASQGSGD